MELQRPRPEAPGFSSFLDQVRLNIIQVQFNSSSSSSEIICYLVVATTQLYCEGLFYYFISLRLLEKMVKKLLSEI